jgi:hypothetical protein
VPTPAGESFALVLTRPLKRGREKRDLAGLADRAQVDADLLEWPTTTASINYGEDIPDARVGLERWVRTARLR